MVAKVLDKQPALRLVGAYAGGTVTSHPWPVTCRPRPSRHWVDQRIIISSVFFSYCALVWRCRYLIAV